MDDRRKTALKYFDANRDFMDTTVKNNIETYRKGKAVISVTDEDGKPIENVRITAKQLNHEFKYGANIFMLDELETEEKNDIYKKAFPEAFNLATLPFYWDTLEPEEGKPRFSKDSAKIYRRPAPDLCLEYCKEHGIEPKMHCLNYDHFSPEWIRNADVPTHKRKLEKRFSELAEHYADVIPSWEVTNETHWGRYDESASKFYWEDDFVEWSFLTAEKYFHNNHLVINDGDQFDYYWGNRSPYFMEIERLLRNPNVHLDSIGMQFHSWGTLNGEPNLARTRYNPEHIYNVLDTYAKLGKKLQITEMTIPAYSSSEEDEAIQAELIEKLYAVFFSHPNMEAIIYWNLVDGYAFGAEQGDMTKGENVYYGGLMNFDLSKKKAFDVIKNLFGKKWRTKADCTTDENGKTHFRGFYGDYELTVSANGKTKTLVMPLSEMRKNEIKIKM